MSYPFEQGPNEVITHSPELRDAALGILGAPLPLRGVAEVSRQLPTDNTAVRVIYYADNHTLMVERTDPIIEDPTGDLHYLRSCELDVNDGTVLSYLEVIGSIDEEGDVVSGLYEEMGKVIRSALTDPTYILPEEQREIFALEDKNDRFTQSEHDMLLDAFRNLPGTI